MNWCETTSCVYRALGEGRTANFVYSFFANCYHRSVKLNIQCYLFGTSISETISCEYVF